MLNLHGLRTAISVASVFAFAASASAAGSGREAESAAAVVTPEGASSDRAALDEGGGGDPRLDADGADGLAADDAGLAARLCGVRVDRVTFSVLLGDGHRYRVVGFYYHRGERRPRSLQVAIHGASYTHRYWDAPDIGGHPYSYARFMAAQGRPVLALDLLGTGESDRPDGDFLNLEQTAVSVHQVLATLRTRRSPLGHAADELVLVGHSNGSITAIFTQATYHDADALVITGWEHATRPSPVDPSQLIPLLATPYVTVPGPLRTFLFYLQAAADPRVIAFDNAELADTITRGQFFDLVAVVSPTPTLDRVADATGDVLVQVGDHDLLAPASFSDGEAGFWTHARSVTVQRLAVIGHSYNMHRDNFESWIGIDLWLARHTTRR